MRRRRPTPKVLIVVLLALAACGDDGGDDGTPSSTRESVTTASSEPDEEGLAGEGTAVLEELAQTLLIQPAELGDAAFADQGYSPGSPVSPCGGVGADPAPDVLAGTALASEPAATTVVEELRVYGSPEDAAAAFDGAASATAPACGTGVDVAAEVGADRAVAFTGDSTYVVALVADTVLAFHVAGTALDPLEVAAFGAGKVLAALEN
jgi:hypothetical protein